MDKNVNCVNLDECISHAERLSSLETSLDDFKKDLVGNGKLGRIGVLEQQFRNVQRIIWMMIGGLYVLNILEHSGLIDLAKWMGNIVGH